MFTGIISAIGTITSSAQQGDLRLTISCPWNDLKIGESIACNGACLTVIETVSDGFVTELSGETTNCTAPHWNIGDKVNMERAMQLGDRLDGHIVTGHVDGLSTIKQIGEDGDSHILQIEAPDKLARFIAAKGSVTLNGVSLTVNKVEGTTFWVNIIPHTWKMTTLGERKQGDTLNTEIDIIARYVERLTA
ncbi:MAG: riboflavin synthase [Rickettsiales bacterium]